MRLKVLPLALLFLSACRNDRSELLEAQLRTRERELRELRAEVDSNRLINEALERELLQRKGFPVPPRNPNSPVPATRINSIREITLGAGTSGVDEDRIPGDEALGVVIVPKDEEGSPIKVLGSAVVTAREITAQGTKIFLCSWDISALEFRKSYKSGLLSSGYQLTLPWKKLPTQSKIRVEVKFTTSEGGQVFEAEKDVTIRPPAELSPTALPSSPEPMSEPPPEMSVLPQPTPFAPSSGLRDAIRILPPIPIIEPKEP